VDATQVLAVDIPSGVDALTGTAGPSVLAASRTVTFQALKPGLLFGRGAELSGEVDVVDIGLSLEAGAEVICHYVTRDDVAMWWPHRGRHAHKWNAAARIVAGSPGMLGAARLAASAAGTAGASLVSLSSPGLDPAAGDEVVQPPLPGDGWAEDVLGSLERFGALVIGPGLGRAAETIRQVHRIVDEAPTPIVVDGDGLFAFASLAASSSFGERSIVLTPHDGEYDALVGHRPDADRIEAARALASSSRCTVLLKGATTVVSAPDGEVLVVDRGDARLATAGTGDVLSGIIGALLACGLGPLRAAAAAAWVHGEAATLGPRRGLLAGDLTDLIPTVLGRLE
jgi:NAD(P)H-hydrate epimerase